MDLSEVDFLIWDIDGVLMYVRGSYRKAISDSVQYYFDGLMGLGLENTLVSVDDTQHFKLVEGFNDDWKLSYALVLCFLTNFVHHSGGIEPLVHKPRDLSGKASVLKKLGAHKVKDLSLDLSMVTKEIAHHGAGLEGTEKALAHVFSERDVRSAKDYWFPDVIKRVFQEEYLGTDLFRKKYREEPYFIRHRGLINDEEPIVRKDVLEALGKRFRMGVASGRDRFEAEYSLSHHGLQASLPKDLIVSSEDVKHGKPDPEPLLLCRKKMEERYGKKEGSSKAAYIGDSVDDVRAAKKAGFYSIGCLSAVADLRDREGLMEEFRKLKCDLVVEDANKIIGYI